MLPQIDRHFAYCPRVVPGHCISCPWGQMDCPGDNGTMQRSSAAPALRDVRVLYCYFEPNFMNCVVVYREIRLLLLYPV